MTWDQVLIAFATLTLGSGVQAAIGFGAGMVSMPLLVLGGIPMHQAMGLILPNNVAQTAINTWQSRDHIVRDGMWSMIGLRIIGLTVGIGILAQFVHDQTRARQVIGAALLCALGVHTYLRPHPRPRVAWGWTLLSGLVSGLMAGVVMMGGPALVLWVMAHDWSTRQQRSFLWIQFLLMMPVQATLLVTQFGTPVWQSLGWGCLLAPAGWLGAHLGGWVGHHLSPHRLRRAMSAMLVLIAGWALLAPWLWPTSR